VSDRRLPGDDRGDRRDDGDNGDRDDGEIDLRVVHPTDELSALLDGELSPDDEAAVRRHLDGCEPCRIEHDAVEAVRRTLRGLPTVPAPPGFVGELIERRHRANRRGAALTLLAAGLALVVGVLAADGMRDGGGPPTPRELSAGAGLPRWDAGRPSPDERMSLPVRRGPSTGDGEVSVLDRARGVGGEMLDLVGG